MEQLQHVDSVEPPAPSSRRRRHQPKFNVHDPGFDFHDPEYLAYIEHAPVEEKKEALAAALDVAWAGRCIKVTPAQLREGRRRGLSFDEMKQWLDQ